MKLLVARIGRPHGVKGEVGLDIRTDIPQRRLIVGEAIAIEPPTTPATPEHPRLTPFPATLTVASVRHDPKRGWFVSFHEVGDRTAAEGLRGASIIVDEVASDEADAWYPHELEGLRAELIDGGVAGVVAGIEHLAAQDALIIEEADGNRVLVPLVSAIVPIVDVGGGRVVLDPPGGLLAAKPEVA